MKLHTTAVALAAATLFAVPALAAKPSLPPLPPPCSLTDIEPAATRCAGFVAIPSGDTPAGKIFVADVLHSWGYLAANDVALLPVPWKIEEPFAASGSFDADTITLGTPIKGDTVMLLKFGGPGGGNLALYNFDAGDHLDRIGYVNPFKHGLSHVSFYVSTPVPEPQTYALMLAGLAVTAFIARRRRAD